MTKKVLACAIFFLFGINSIYAQSEPQDKEHVDLEEIQLTKEGIFLKIQRDWVPVNQICFDGIGYLVPGEDSKASFFWECPKCDYKNNFWSKICGNCGYEPRKSRS